MSHNVHKITRELVNQALENNALIVIGNLKGLRNRDKKKMRKKFNRKIAGFPYFKFFQQIKYKATLAGIKVFVVSESYTSQTCFKCHTRDKKARKTQGLYLCRKCGEENADRNAAFNIARKALGYISEAGVTVNIPRILPSVEVTRCWKENSRPKEATGFNR